MIIFIIYYNILYIILFFNSIINNIFYINIDIINNLFKTYTLYINYIKINNLRFIVFI